MIYVYIIIYIIYIPIYYILSYMYLYAFDISLFFISMKDQPLVPASAQETSHVASEDIMKASSAKPLRLPSICPPRSVQAVEAVEKSDCFFSNGLELFGYPLVI